MILRPMCILCVILPRSTLVSVSRWEGATYSPCRGLFSCSFVSNFTLSEDRLLQPNKRPLQVIEEMMRKMGGGTESSPPPSMDIDRKSGSQASSTPRTPTSGSSTSAELDAPSGDRRERTTISGAPSKSQAVNIPSTSAVVEADSILDILPTSYDEFESKDIHLTIEKKLSSPLISPVRTQMDPSGPFSPTSLGAAAAPPAVSTELEDVGWSPPPDQDDLEVQMINESFEELQKRQKMYESQQLKDLFYSFPSASPVMGKADKTLQKAVGGGKKKTAEVMGAVAPPSTAIWTKDEAVPLVAKETSLLNQVHFFRFRRV